MKIHENAALHAAGVAIAEGPHLIGPTLRDVLRPSKGRGREVARSRGRAAGGGHDGRRRAGGTHRSTGSRAREPEIVVAREHP